MIPDQLEAAKTQVKQILAQSPREYNQPKTRWTLATIQMCVPFLKHKSIPGVWQILKRLGISRKQSAAFIRSPDLLFREKVRIMMDCFERALYHPDTFVTLFQDELSYYRNPTIAPSWGESGVKQPKVLKAPGTDKLTRIGAVLNGYNGEIIYQQGNKFGIKQMSALYEQIREAYSQPTIYVVQDNCPSVHQHPTVLDKAASLGITPIFLPTYASWLNPIEKLWLWLKSDVLHNHLWAHDLSQLRYETSAFLDQFLTPSDELLRYVGLLPD